jgi:cytochrome c biogenesis protein CcmG, thiol:disulfide interchange protein DsbE
MMRLRTSALLMGLLALAVAACNSGGEANVDGGGGPLQPLEALGTGDPLPDAALPYLDGAGALTTADLRGTPAVINFWATWCAFCVDEMPDFEEVHASLDGRVRFIGVNVEDPRDKAARLAAETGVTYDLVVDDDRSFYRAVRARGMPTTLLVDGAGVIVHRHAGPLNAEQLADLIHDHLEVTTTP